MPFSLTPSTSPLEGIEELRFSAQNCGNDGALMKCNRREWLTILPRFASLIGGFSGVFTLLKVSAAEPQKNVATINAKQPFTIESIRGKVVYWAEGAERLWGIKVVPEAKDRIIALETVDGTLLPLVEDIRGRAFRVDDRLRKMDVELLVRRYADGSAAKVLGVYSLEKNGKFEVDYWCEVCAIAMYEKKECECCQADNVLRRRPVAASPAKANDATQLKVNSGLNP